MKKRQNMLPGCHSAFLPTEPEASMRGLVHCILLFQPNSFAQGQDWCAKTLQNWAQALQNNSVYLSCLN